MRQRAHQGPRIRRPVWHHAQCLAVLEVWAEIAKADAGAILARTACWPRPSNRWAKATLTPLRCSAPYPGASLFFIVFAKNRSGATLLLTSVLVDSDSKKCGMRFCGSPNGGRETGQVMGLRERSRGNGRAMPNV